MNIFVFSGNSLIKPSAFKLQSSLLRLSIQKHLNCAFSRLYSAIKIPNPELDICIKLFKLTHKVEEVFKSLLVCCSCLFNGNDSLFKGNSSLFKGNYFLFKRNASLFKGNHSLFKGSGSLFKRNASLFSGNDSLLNGSGSVFKGSDSVFKGTGKKEVFLLSFLKLAIINLKSDYSFLNIERNNFVRILSNNNQL